MSVRPSAFAVHVLTASGAALALFAMMSAAQADWRAMFLWLGLSLLVDGIDGPLARRVDIRTHAPHWDGIILDLVIDYITYVFIPAYALVYSGLAPGAPGMLAAAVMTVSSVIYYADTRMKTGDNSFQGFPGVWHMPLVVLFVVWPPAWATVTLVLVLAAAQFTRLKFIHPVRTRRWRPLNLAVFTLWFVAAAVSVWRQMDPGGLTAGVLVIASLWLLLAGIAMQIVPERRV